MRSTKLLYFALALIYSMLFKVAVSAATLEESFTVDRINANHNEVSQVRDELCFWKDQLLGSGTNAMISLAGDSDRGVLFKLTLVAERLEAPQAQKFLELAQRYVTARLEGHSLQFSSWLILHGGETWPNELQDLVSGNAQLKSELAFPWIRQDIHKCIAFPDLKDTKAYSVVYVVDGDIAWLYLALKVGENGEMPLPRFRIDSIELSPATSGTISNSFNTLVKHGAVFDKHMNERRDWWSKLHNLLKENTGIIWRIPSELNPSIVYN